MKHMNSNLSNNVSQQNPNMAFGSFGVSKRLLYPIQTFGLCIAA